MKYDYKKGDIRTYSAITDFLSSGYSTFGGFYGAAWGLGWEGGRAITSTEFYQEAKFNFWYNMMERKLGPPSYNNRFAWEDYFYNYFKP